MVSWARVGNASLFSMSLAMLQDCFRRHLGNWARIGAKFAIVILVSSLLAGCVTPPNARSDLLDFLQVGKTTREEAILELGQPSGSFEQDRILTYRIGRYGAQGYFIISPKVILPAQGASWQNVRFSLVLVFDEAGRLRKHELVSVD
jgi:hypothetical protein